jgi:PPOX class probable F420-dependent enzyme
MATRTLEPFARQWAVLLVTHKRDGTPVGTPVSIAVEGDRAFVRTWDTAWKVKRIRNDPLVEVAPCTPLGKPTGPPLRARARVLDGEESARAGRLLARKHPILHGLLVPLAHRLKGYETVHVELTPVSGHDSGAADGAASPGTSSARPSGWHRRAG